MKTYPYSAWVLTPAFRVKQVEFVEAYESWNGTPRGSATESGKTYYFNEIFDTKEDAQAWGVANLFDQQKTLEKRLETIEKKRLNLSK